jgi:hypothetical protein
VWKGLNENGLLNIPCMSFLRCFHTSPNKNTRKLEKYGVSVTPRSMQITIAPSRHLAADFVSTVDLTDICFRVLLKKYIFFLQ